jgi:nucleoside-diphosphate-sugar epimerase
MAGERIAIMRALVIGGTGLISRGIVKHLLARGAEVRAFNRGRCADPASPADVRTVLGDRDDADALSAVAGENFDIVIDMVCFRNEQAAAAVAAFGGKCRHYIFCSTVCTYGTGSSSTVLIDELSPQHPTSGYGRDKVACEQTFFAAHRAGRFAITIIRPSQTYGPGGPMIDNLEFDAVAWARIERGLPVLCASDGLGQWVSTHRDDCGKLFAYAALRPSTYGKAYNATRPQHTTWSQYYRQVSAALGKETELIYMPRDWIVRRDPERFGLLKEITGFHGAYDSSAARRDVPEFDCDIDLTAGAAEVFADQRRRGKWRDSREDLAYQAMVDEAVKLGQEPQPA